jgi:hypothetical protein
MRGIRRRIGWGLLALCLISQSGCALLLLPMATGAGWGAGKETDQVLKALKKSPDEGGTHETVDAGNRPAADAQRR